MDKKTLIIIYALALQHIKICWRSGAVLLGVAFLFIITLILPFALGADLLLLQRVAPALLWVALLLTIFLSLEHLWEEDYKDGSLDYLFLSPVAPELLVATRLAAHFIALFLPLAAALALAGILLNLDFDAHRKLWLAVYAAAPALIALGGLGAALTLIAKRGAALTSLIITPLYVPLLIIAASASGQAGYIPIFILLAMSAAAVLLMPFLIVLILRNL